MTIHLINFKNTSIVLGTDLIRTNLIIESCKTTSVVIISDHHVSELYAEELLLILQKTGIEAHLLTFHAGEASKTRTNKELLEDQMQSLGLGRDTTLIGIGGGVTTDLSGFIASTYCRGIPLILIPTSLLGMIDASIGGKTGVNTSYGKNLIGTFYMPESIIINFSCLDSLPIHHIKEGVVEMIKTALIYDENLFLKLASYSFDADFINEDFKEMIHATCKIKLSIVEKDFEEKEGIRRILNFGHTVAHALELFFEYQISHGEAVALGMIAESYMAMEMGILGQKSFHKVLDILKLYVSARQFDPYRILELMSHDKKSKNKSPRFVMLKDIGKVDKCNGEYCISLNKEVILNALEFILRI